MTSRPSRQLRQAARRPLTVRVVSPPVKQPLFVLDREWWKLVTSGLAVGVIVALSAGAIASFLGLVRWDYVAWGVGFAVVMLGGGGAGGALLIWGMKRKQYVLGIAAAMSAVVITTLLALAVLLLGIAYVFPRYSS